MDKEFYSNHHRQKFINNNILNENREEVMSIRYP